MILPFGSQLHRAPSSWHLMLFCLSLVLPSCKTNALIAVTEAEEVPCAMHGEPCTNAECCSGSCVQGLCATLDKDACASVGSPCTQPIECCSGFCDNETCAPSPGWPLCRVEGERCRSNMECCSGACANATDSEPSQPIPLAHCQPVDGCKPVGELCQYSVECCSGGGCIADAFSGVKRCELGCLAPGLPCQVDQECCSQQCDPSNRLCSKGTTPAFLEPGEICGAMGLMCKFPNPAGAGLEADCFETKEGVNRCRSFVPARVFEQVGTLCETGSECCDPSSTSCAWLCLPGSNGPACAQGCVVEGGACRAAADCCLNSGPATCHRGRCRLTGVACAQLGQPCLDTLNGTDCCSTKCSTVRGPFTGSFCIAPD